ncbi:MAG TPA: nucleoside hydrolase [Homoserinimonas sp.]|nr:nucleoside hydrolase [Homoserinimonas sp.]
MPIPLIIDTDPGVDDMLAILLALASPELDVRAITTTYGNVGLEETTINARRLLALAGREDIPVAAGATSPLVHPSPGRAADIHGSDGMGGLSGDLPEPTVALQSARAVDLMAQVLRDASDPVTICALGPFTNVAVLLAAHPELVSRIDRIVVMGGAIRGGNTSAVAEFNIWCDPEAAQRVFNSGVPVTMVGLDSTREVPVDESWLDDLASRGEIAGVAAEITRRYNEYFRSLGRTTFVIHDAITIAAVLDPELVPTVPASVSVECGQGPARGCTVVDQKQSEPHRVDVGVGADAPRIKAMIAERLGSL